MERILPQDATFQNQAFPQARGPSVPSKDTDLYFDWRRLKEKPKQDHNNVHPGTEWFP